MDPGEEDKNVVTEINNSFNRICRRLSQGSLNYCAYFKLFRCEQMAGEPLDAVVAKALGEEARVGGTQSATEKDVIDALQSGLTNRGERGIHPSLDYLESPKSQKDFEEVISSVRDILDPDNLILSFWLKSGHPFYPVFWDFAFMIETAEDSILFIGSSSD